MHIATARFIRGRRAIARVSLAALALLAGCAAYGPGDVRVGQTAEDVARSMGAPTGRYTLPDDRQRLEYARGPMGRHTFMIDLDARGRVVQVEQVLDEAHFLRVTPGMSRDELLRLLGRPASIAGLALGNAEVWSWRYPTNNCLWFRVTVGREGVVRDGGGHLPDPACGRRGVLG